MDLNGVEFINLRSNSIYCRRQRFTSKNRHWHAYYEIELVAEADGEHIINGHKYKNQSGDVFMMRLTDFHEFPETHESEHWVVEIPPAALPDEVVNLLVLAEGDLITHLSPEDFNHVTELFYMLEKCNDKNDSFHEMQKKHLTCSLILFVLDRVENNFAEKCTRNNIQIREIISYIQNNLFTDLSISTIAAHFYISKTYLSKFFKKNTGITLKAYIRKTRLAHASKLVIATNKKMIEIAEASGFNALSSFMRDFKNEFGMSPTEMRRSYRENNNGNEE